MTLITSGLQHLHLIGGKLSITLRFKLVARVMAVSASTEATEAKIVVLAVNTLDNSL